MQYLLTLISEKTDSAQKQNYEYQREVLMVRELKILYT